MMGFPRPVRSIAARISIFHWLSTSPSSNPVDHRSLAAPHPWGCRFRLDRKGVWKRRLVRNCQPRKYCSWEQWRSFVQELPWIRKVQSLVHSTSMFGLVSSRPFAFSTQADRHCGKTREERYLSSAEGSWPSFLEIHLPGLSLYSYSNEWRLYEKLSILWYLLSTTFALVKSIPVYYSSCWYLVSRSRKASNLHQLIRNWV
jgi:hypothetical protein